MNTQVQKPRASGHRERLIEGMITAANRDGYARANVSAVIAAAGVSRPTFYAHFENREDCFLAAVADTQRRLAARAARAVAAAPGERAAHATLEALISFALEHPAQAQFLTGEPMAAGAPARAARARYIAELAEAIERAYAPLAPEARVPDLAVAMMLGGAERWLSARLRRREGNLAAARGELLGWIGCYERPIGRSRWRHLAPGPAPARSPYLPPVGMRAPAPLPPGRPRAGEQSVAENHRLRIMVAVALLAEEKGYAASTVAEIAARAGLDARSFYARFAGKQEAFMAVHELGFQELMALTAGAFFTGTSWPERSWEAGRALTQYLEANPTVAHVGFVEAYAVGPAAVQRVEDSHVAFAIFLREGYQHLGEREGPSRVAVELIIATIFEIIYHQSQAPGRPRLSENLGAMLNAWLTPFLGPEEADAFIEAKLSGASG